MSINNGFGSVDSGAIRTTKAVKTLTSRASPKKTAARHSADNVTAAYTLLQQATAAQRTMLPREDHRRKSSSPSYDWSVNNIGFNDIKSEARKRTETENRQGYERASFACCDADKPYIAEATHFRFQYPHTLGRIQALSKARSGRFGVRRDRIRANDDRKCSTN